jgi:hypothetical protein
MDEPARGAAGGRPPTTERWCGRLLAAGVYGIYVSQIPPASRIQRAGR